MPPADQTPQPRRSARVILLSPDDAVLLIEFAVKRSGADFVFWATPGGEVENGESDLAAAERELREELNLVLHLEGPVHAAAGEFEHKGATVSNTDVYFTGRCARDAPRLDAHTEAEHAAMRRWRWWSLDDIERSDANIFPEDLEPVARRLLGR